jgi:hypothetical protein
MSLWSNILFNCAVLINLIVAFFYPFMDPVPSKYDTVRSESHCALRLRYVDLVVSIEVAVKVCCCFSVFSC